METIQIECPEGKKIVKTITDNGIIITFEDINPNEVIDNKTKELEKQIEELKEQKQLTPAEKFVLDKVKGVKPSENDGFVRWRYKDGELLFTQDFKNKQLWVIRDNLWLVLNKEYGLNYNEIQQLIKNVMCKYTNNGELTPRCLI
jgi:hypothetical protein